MVAPVIAAHAGDANAHKAAHLRWTDLPIPRQRRAELAGRFLLGLKLFTSLAQRDDRTLHELALRLTPFVNTLVHGTPEIYEAVLRSALGEPKEGDDFGAVGPVGVDMSATALLGALLGDDPALELAEMRPHLETYYRGKWDGLRDRELRPKG